MKKLIMVFVIIMNVERIFEADGSDKSGFV
jgi:hypothetical protein